MTPHNVAATWTWTGTRNLPTWLDRHHHWHTDRPVIHTTDGPRHLYNGWLVALWSDGVITVASATVADRVYGPNGLAGRLQRAEAATDGELRRQLDAAIAALGKSETALAALRQGRNEARLAAANAYGQRDRLRRRITDLANRWRLPGHISMPQAAADIDEALDRESWAPWPDPIRRVLDVCDRLRRASTLADGQAHTDRERGILQAVDRITAALAEPVPATATTGHVYLSTGCYHGDHAYCQSMTGLNGAKRPASCKFCQAACQCGCHGETAQPAPLTPAEEARLAQAGIDTPGCDCGHEGMGVSWHRDDCPWRRSAVDCPGRELPGPAAHNDGPSVEECRDADRRWPLQKTGE